MRLLHLAAALLVLLPPVGGKAASAQAPAAPPVLLNITAAMAKGGCKAFAASPDAYSTFQSTRDGDVTAFCPIDDAVRSFMPRYKNLTADDKASLLLSHALPVYYPQRSLKSNNGVMNTLATDGSARNFNLTAQTEDDHASPI